MKLSDEQERANCVRSERAAARVNFALTYARTEPRRLHAEGIDGPWIDDAFAPGERSPGEWQGGENAWLDRHTVDGWIDVYAGYAVQEAVHEALEWFQVDGRPWLDPHGAHETLIQAAVDDLVARLVELRKED